MPATASTSSSRNAALASSIQCRSSTTSTAASWRLRAVNARVASLQQPAPAHHRVRQRRAAARGPATPRNSNSSGRSAANAGSSAEHRGLDPLAGDLGRVALVDAEVVAVQGEHGQERDVASVRDAAGRVDRQAARGAVGDELVHQAALAHAGVADDPDRPPVPGQRLLQRGLQRGALRVAADEPRQPAGGGHRLQPRLRRAAPDQLQHPLGRRPRP